MKAVKVKRRLVEAYRNEREVEVPGNTGCEGSAGLHQL